MINLGEEGLMKTEGKDRSKTIDPTVIIEEIDPEILPVIEDTIPETLPGETEIRTGDLIQMTSEEITKFLLQEMKTEKDMENQRDTTTIEEEMEAPTKTDPAVETEDTPQREVHQMR